MRILNQVVLRRARWVPILALLAACTRPESSASRADAALEAPSKPVEDAAKEAATADREPRDAAPDARVYKVVLHMGDSTVGGDHALTKALKGRFQAEGSRFVSNTVNSESIVTLAMNGHLKELLAKHDPDLVLLNLGTNEVFVPVPEALAARIDAIVKRIGARDCIWIGPPTWKPDTGIVKVIREHAAPCRFFDSSDLKLDRFGDGIHPTEAGGETWASLIWAFFKGAAPSPRDP